MKVWLFNPYGPLPDEAWRPYRFSMLAEALAAGGHTVVWWTSSFSHHFKRHRSVGAEERSFGDRFAVRLVPTPGYSSNISVGRMSRDFVFAARAYRSAIRDPPPDVVVSAESPLTVGFAGPRVARHFGVPFVSDVMDLWPELFEVVFPRWLKPWSPALFKPIAASRRRHWRRAAAIVALCDSYLAVAREAVSGGSAEKRFGIVYNGIDVALLRRSIPVGVSGDPARSVPTDGLVRVIFAGSLGPNYDIPVILEMARRDKGRGGQRRYSVTVAGDGPQRTSVERAAEEGVCRYLGAIKPAELAAAYADADVALCAYAPGSNVGIPDKFYDYVAAGLPIVNSLRGDVARIISDSGVGRQYRAGSAESMLQELDALTADAGEMQRASASAWQIGTRYDAAAQFAEYVRLIEEVGRSSRSPAPESPN